MPAGLPITAFLSGSDALSLLHTVAGRRDWDVEAALAVVGLCDRLPLAIRIAGARLARRRDVHLARFAGRLADEKARLDILSTTDVGVRACFEVTYADLGVPSCSSACWQWTPWRIGC